MPQARRDEMLDDFELARERPFACSIRDELDAGKHADAAHVADERSAVAFVGSDFRRDCSSAPMVDARATSPC